MNECVKGVAFPYYGWLNVNAKLRDFSVYLNTAFLAPFKVNHTLNRYHTSFNKTAEVAVYTV